MGEEKSNTWPDGKHEYRPWDPEEKLWPMCDEKTRVLDAFYTSYGTRLSVQNGKLLEEKLDSYRPQNRGSAYNAPFDPPPSSLIISSCPPPRRHKSPEVPDHSQTIRVGKAALKYYNSKHHTKYEFIDPVESDGTPLNGKIWYHCNFTARKPSEDGLGLSSTRLFFAELMVLGANADGSKYLVTACRPIDSIKTANQCQICDEGILHPLAGFRHGRYVYKPRVLRRRTNRKVLAE